MRVACISLSQAIFGSLVCISVWFNTLFCILTVLFLWYYIFTFSSVDGNRYSFRDVTFCTPSAFSSMDGNIQFPSHYVRSLCLFMYGRKQIQFPKRYVVFRSEYWTMGKVTRVYLCISKHACAVKITVQKVTSILKTRSLYVCIRF